MRRLCAVATALMLVSARPAAAQVPDDATPGLGSIRNARPSIASACPNLSSELQQLVEATDRASFSAEHSLAFTDGGVQVMITLTAPDAVLPAEYAVVEQARFDTALDALAPVDQLCALSVDPVVQSVQVPLAPDLTIAN